MRQLKIRRLFLAGNNKTLIHSKEDISTYVELKKDPNHINRAKNRQSD